MKKNKRGHIYFDDKPDAFFGKLYNPYNFSLFYIGVDWDYKIRFIPYWKVKKW